MGNITKRELHPSLLKLINEGAANSQQQSTKLIQLKSTVTISAATATVDIKISEYNKDTDILMVFKNSVYLEENDDYTITSDSRSINRVGGYEWNNAVFNFIVFKNVAANQNRVYDDNHDPHTTILLNENTNEFHIGKGKENGVYRDYTSKMKKSFVSLDRFEGKTQKIGNTFINNTFNYIYDDSGIGKNLLHEFSLTFNSMGLAEGEHYSTHCRIQFDNNEYYNNSIIRVLYDSPSKVEPNTQYSVSAYYKGIPLKFAIYQLDNNGISITASGEDMWHNEKYTFTTKPKTRYIMLYLAPIEDHIHFQQSDEDINYFKVQLEKGTVTPYERSKVKLLYRNNYTLSSLPNGIKDEIRDGKHYDRVAKMLLTRNMGWTLWKSENGFTAFYCKPYGLKAFPNDRKDGIVCNRFESLSYNETQHPTKEGVSLYSAYSYIGVVISSDKASTIEQFENYLDHNKVIVIAEKYTDLQTINDEFITFKAKPNQKIVIDCPLPVSSTHTISLNDKAYFDKEGEVTDYSLSQISKLRRFVNKCKFDFLFKYNGYIKFPEIWGGLMIQWGRTTIEVNNNWLASKDFKFTKRFRRSPFLLLAQPINVSGDNASNFTASAYFLDDDVYGGRINLIDNRRVNGTHTVEITWFAIGN